MLSSLELGRSAAKALSPSPEAVHLPSRVQRSFASTDSLLADPERSCSCSGLGYTLFASQKIDEIACRR